MELKQKTTERRVRDLQDILDACYQAAGVIVSARYDEGFASSWGDGGAIPKLDHYVMRLEVLLKNLSRSQTRTTLTRELFGAVIRDDLTIDELREGSEADAKTNREA